MPSSSLNEPSKLTGNFPLWHILRIGLVLHILVPTGYFRRLIKAFCNESIRDLTDSSDKGEKACDYCFPGLAYTADSGSMFGIAAMYSQYDFIIMFQCVQQ